MKHFVFITMILAGSGYAGQKTIEPFEWESAAPIDELIEEDSGNVTFYKNVETSVDSSEQLPMGYIPKNPERRFQVMGHTQPSSNRAPASSDDSQATTNRLKIIEDRLTKESPASNSSQVKREPTFWGNVQEGATKATDTVKDGLGQLYQGITSAPTDLSFGEDTREIAVIQSDKGYIPKRLDLIKGVKTRVYITGTLDRKVAFVSDTYNIQRSIKGKGVTIIEFTPDSTGIYKFYDPINKMEGWFLVR
jgi:hypothetical protein